MGSQQLHAVLFQQAGDRFHRFHMAHRQVQQRSHSRTHHFRIIYIGCAAGAHHRGCSGAVRRPLHMANSYKLPVRDRCADIILSLFAPAPAGEFDRILVHGGKVIMAVPGTEHLWELKEAIYDEAYKNDEDKHSLEGFRLCRREKISYKANINGKSNVQALFSMTPYIHRTGKESMERLRAIDNIELTLSFVLLCFEREN